MLKLFANKKLSAVTAAIALITCIVYTVQSVTENAFFFLVPLMLALGIVLTVVYVIKNRITPLPGAVCYSVAIGGYVASMLTNVVNTYVNMAHANLVLFYLIAAMMLLCSILGIVASFCNDD